MRCWSEQICPIVFIKLFLCEKRKNLTAHKKEIKRKIIITKQQQYKSDENEKKVLTLDYLVNWIFCACEFQSFLFFLRARRLCAFELVVRICLVTYDNDWLGVDSATFAASIFKLCRNTCTDSYEKTSTNTTIGTIIVGRSHFTTRWSTSIHLLLYTCKFVKFCCIAWFFIDRTNKAPSVRVWIEC